MGWPGVTLGSHTASRAPPPHRATLVTLVTPGASKQAHTKSPLQLEFLTSTFLTRHLSHAQDQAEAEAQAQAVAAQGQTSNGVSIGALLTDVLQSLGPVLAILTKLWPNFGHRQRKMMEEIIGTYLRKIDPQREKNRSAKACLRFWWQGRR